MEKDEIFVFGITFKATGEAFEKIKKCITDSATLIYVKRVPNRCFLEIVEKKLEKEEKRNAKFDYTPK